MEACLLRFLLSFAYAAFVWAHLQLVKPLPVPIPTTGAEPTSAPHCGLPPNRSAGCRSLKRLSFGNAFDWCGSWIGAGSVRVQRSPSGRTVQQASDVGRCSPDTSLRRCPTDSTDNPRPLVEGDYPMIHLVGDQDPVLK